MYKRVTFFQPKTLAKHNYQNSVGEEQKWVPWFAPILAPAAQKYELEVKLLDARISDLVWKEQIMMLNAEDILAVTVMTGQAIRDAYEASEIARERGAYIIWGGPHVTLFPYQTLTQAPIHACIPGFGFRPFYSLLSNLKNSPECLYSDYGVLHKDQSNKINSVNRFDFQDTVLPPYDLSIISDWKPYINEDVAIATRTINFITSEGCPRHCTFCSEPTTSGRTWYTRPIEQVISVVVTLIERSSANGLKLHDPNFFHNTERALKFARTFSQKIGIPWAATIHPEDLLNLSDDELNLFATYGLSRVLVGLESPDPRIVRLAGKRYDPVQIPMAVKRLAKAGIRGMFTFIVGWPGTDQDHYEATIQCAFDIRKVWSEHQAKIHFLEPWPGTPIYHLMVKQGFVFPNSLEEWAKIDYYQAQFMQIHDLSIGEAIRRANSELSPYVDA